MDTRCITVDKGHVSVTEELLEARCGIEIHNRHWGHRGCMLYCEQEISESVDEKIKKLVKRGRKETRGCKRTEDWTW